MSPYRYRRAKHLAAAVAGCLLLLVAVLLLWPYGALDVRVAGLRKAGGALCVSVVLRNGTSGTLNVVDDSAGNPAFILDERGGRGPTGEYGVLLTDMANTLKINLAPGAMLTNSVWITNPPPRFRLRVQVRDLAAEGRGLPLHRLMGKALAMAVVKWRQRMRNPDLELPASRWIESKPARPGHPGAARIIP